MHCAEGAAVGEWLQFWASSNVMLRQGVALPSCTFIAPPERGGGNLNTHEIL